MRIISLFYLLLFTVIANSQTNQTSIHQEQLEYYNSLNQPTSYYESLTNNTVQNNSKAGCTPDKVVYGWHPYWVGSAYNNYDWSLLTHFSFFSYEVDPATGNALSTHGWSTSAAVDAALANGVKVTLCVTLFGSSDLATFLTNNTAKQTLITNLISLVQAKGAHGVNIDFEGLPSSQTTNFANFMVDLSNQMHAAIPGSEVSTVLYAVDWSGVFDFSIMEPEVDHYIVMGYAYYYQGSSTTGPCDPLYHFGSSYNYTLSKTTSYYLDAGCPKNKLVMGLPYYGYEWQTSSMAIPSTTTSSGVARTYSYVKNNSSGNYSTANHNWDQDSYTDIYTFNNGSNNQCFITLEDGFRKRLQHIRTSGIAGIGIWALGYDNGYTELWDAIGDFMTECYVDSCAGMIHDFGGPTKNYYNDEDYTWTISPANATAINVSFSSFNVENNYDYLYIYDGPTTASPLIGVYTGTNTPGSFTTSTGHITFRFTSDVSTVSSGFLASYNCVIDNTPPLTSMTPIVNWQTTDFTASFTDIDDIGIFEKFYNVVDYDGSEWRSNSDYGFFYDEFIGTTINPEWTSQTGTWTNNSNQLNHTDEAINNSNIYASITQDNTSTYLYHWQGEINGTGSNRRAGLHFFCSDPTLDQRGDSYMVFWRVDQDKCQIYKSVGNSIVLMTDDDCILNPNVNYDFKIFFDPSTGKINAYLDNVLVSTWTDPSPLSSGNSISPRTGNANGIFDNLMVYKSRNTNENIGIGSTTDEVRFQNPNPLQPACKISALSIDNANNFSSIETEFVNIDWTVPDNFIFINDGNSSDINTFNNNTQIEGNFSLTSDANSDISSYQYSIGTSSGNTDVVNWTPTGSTNILASGLSLVNGQIYFINVKAINGAGLELISSSNGQTLNIGAGLPVANFSFTNSTTVCENELINITNNSINATNYYWEFQNGFPNTSTNVNPSVSYINSGNHQITLHAINGTDTSTNVQFIDVNVVQNPTANFTSNSPIIWPNSTVFLTNNSLDATNYFWDFGDGITSSDLNPWHTYNTTGNYIIALIADNGICDPDTLSQVISVINTSSVENNTLNEITIYPNPTNDIIHLQNVPLNSNVMIYDASGKFITNLSLLATNEIINLSFLSDGLYYLKIISTNQVVVLPIVKK